MSALKENLALAKQAIQYVNKLGITSVNVPFRLKSYLSKFDLFLLLYMRQESKGIMYGKEKETRTKILQILRGPGTKAQKKQQLKKLMKDTGFNPDTFDFQWNRENTDEPDEERIRAVRKAMKFKHGNCGEKSAIAATWLLEKVQNQKAIFWVGAGNWDHAWTILGEVGKLSKQIIRGVSISNWHESTVIVDGWTGDWYAALHPYNPLKSGSAANPFQLYVRKKVQAASRCINVKEECSWPPQFSPSFRLAVATQPNKSYEVKKSGLTESQVLDLLEEIPDDDLEVLSTLADELVKSK